MARSWSATAIRSWVKDGRPAPGSGVPGLWTQSALKAWINDIKVAVQDLGAEEASARLAETAVAVRNRVSGQHQARSGVRPLLTWTVDGALGAPFESVKPDGVIVLLWNLMPEAARAIYTALIDRSPHRSGDYRESVLLFVDDALSGFQAINDSTREVRLVPSVAYARRLEIGKTKTGAPWVKQVAPHIVEETAIISKAKYGQVANVEFTYVDLSGAHSIKSPRFHRVKRGFVETSARYPTIIITPRDQ